MSSRAASIWPCNISVISCHYDIIQLEKESSDFMKNVYLNTEGITQLAVLFFWSSKIMVVPRLQTVGVLGLKINQIEAVI